MTNPDAQTDPMFVALASALITYGGNVYDRNNVRLAHRSCNSKAGAAIRGERERFLRAALWLSDRLTA